MKKNSKIKICSVHYCKSLIISSFIRHLIIVESFKFVIYLKKYNIITKTTDIRGKEKYKKLEIYIDKLSEFSIKKIN